MNIDSAIPRCYRVGEDAVTLQTAGPVRLASQQRIWALAAQFEQQTAIRAVVPGMNNLTLQFWPECMSADVLMQTMVDAWMESEVSVQSPRIREIPVHYGAASGPDLDVVSAHTGLSPEDIIRCHTEAVYTVFFLGFQPGFAYLGGLPEILATPRRATPRAVVPAGSVAIGGSQTGVYPKDAPGGWQIIGHTDVVLFDAARAEPSFWRPGDSVRFVAI